MGVSRLSVHLVEQSTPKNDYVKALFDAVERNNIIKAINENDFDLAWQNFLKIEEILCRACEGSFGNYPFPRSIQIHFATLSIKELITGLKKML